MSREYEGLDGYMGARSAALPRRRSRLSSRSNGHSRLRQSKRGIVLLRQRSK